MGTWAYVLDIFNLDPYSAVLQFDLLLSSMILNICILPVFFIHILTTSLPFCFVLPIQHYWFYGQEQRRHPLRIKTTDAFYIEHITAQNLRSRS